MVLYALNQSSISDSAPSIESVNSQGQEDHADQHHLSVSILAAQVNVTSEHNILDEKRKLNQGKLSNMNAVDDNKGENYSILCVQMKLTFQTKITQSLFLSLRTNSNSRSSEAHHSHQDLSSQLLQQNQTLL